MTSITAVIPSRGLDALLRICVEHLAAALAAAGGDGHRIVVFDNASLVPYRRDAFGLPVDLLRADTHHSYAAACNAGAARAPNDWLLFLNNDVLLQRRTLADMLATSADRRTGICGARLVFPDNSIQHCGVVFGPDQRGPYHDHRHQPSALVPRAARRLQAVTGACMLVRSECFAQLGGFDEGYPFGLEDIDMCLRARQAGWQVLCDQGSDSLHFESMTEGRVDLDVPSRRHFMAKWRGRYGIDGVPEPASGRQSEPEPSHDEDAL
jgi:GT2 family glycosyltransferase